MTANEQQQEQQPQPLPWFTDQAEQTIAEQHQSLAEKLSKGTKAWQDWTAPSVREPMVEGGEIE